MADDGVVLDGAQGEGGGQILRSALALSLVTGRPFELARIRAGRKKPGLLRQHLTAVRAAATIGCAEVRGDSLGSTQLVFAPGRVQPGAYRFDIASAGSAALVVQTVLLALLTASGPSQLTVEGGTHNPNAPPFDFLKLAWLPLLSRLGPSVTAKLVRPGFFPAGGGQLDVDVVPSHALSGFDLIERGTLRRIRVRALVSRLPRSIAQRELATVSRRLSVGCEDLLVEEVQNARGPGNAVIIEVHSEGITEVFTGFGRRGVPAEKVATSVTAEVEHYLQSGVPVGPYLADQLLIPMALAGGGAFRAVPLTSHAYTNMQVLKAFIDADVQVRDLNGKGCEVQVRRPPHSRATPAG